MLSTAMEITSGRYINGRGVSSCIGEELKRLKVSKVYLLGGEKALDITLTVIKSSLDFDKIGYEIGVFKGYCTYENAQYHASKALESGCTAIVGIGGGKCLDTTKAISKIAGIHMGLIPTVLATCVACTNMAIMYKESGAFIGAYYPDEPIAFTIVDYDVLIKAPERYIASGICDSMAKYPELHFSVRDTINCEKVDDSLIQAGHGLAYSNWQVYLENGQQAYLDNKMGIISNQYTAIANTNLISTAIISGLARGSKQLAIAHAVYNHSSTLFPDTWRRYLHGEIVSVGVVLQEFYNGANQEEIDSYLSIAKSMGVPVSLREIDIIGSQSNLDKLSTAIAKDFPDFTENDAFRLRESIEKIVSL